MAEESRQDRELIELLNELRVTLPGVQVLFAFLLVVPFSQGWQNVDTLSRYVYFGSLLCAAASSALLIAPSSMHRLRFRAGDKERLLFTSNKLMIVGSFFLALAMTLTVFLISHVLFGEPFALVAGALTGLWFAWFWFGLPLFQKP